MLKNGCRFLSLSIVIPTHNGRVHLERCLASISRHAPVCTQVIVVDDASTDGTATWVRREYPGVELVSLPANRGFCAAANAGIAHARGDVVEMLNNDTEVCPGWAEAALRHFAEPSVGSVAPLVLAMADPHLIDSAGQHYHMCGWGQDRGRSRAVAQQYETVRNVFGPSASAGFYRRAALERAGGFLPEYEAHCDDIDLSFRLRAAGYRCVYEPASRVLHKGSASYGKYRERLVTRIARNEELVYWANLTFGQLAGSIVPHFAFQSIRLLRRAWSGELWAFLTGKWQAIRMWPFVTQQRARVARLRRDADVRVSFQLATGPSAVWQGWNWMTQKVQASYTEKRRLDKEPASEAG